MHATTIPHGAVVKLRQASYINENPVTVVKLRQMDPQRAALLEELKAETEKARRELEFQLKAASLDRVMSNLACYRDITAMIRTRPIDRESLEIQQKAHSMFRQSHWDCQKLHPGRNIVVFECFGRRKQVWRAYG